MNARNIFYAYVLITTQFHLDAEDSENLLDVAGGAEGGAFADLSNPRYKTEICRNFKERARCVYGDSCQFAHGRRELREVVRNTKYKTKLCQKYWITGYCVYGPRFVPINEEYNKKIISFRLQVQFPSQREGYRPRTAGHRYAVAKN